MLLGDNAQPSSQLIQFLSDLKQPANWFERLPNKQPRKIIMHAGPTNSGKTFRALEAFLSADSGVYCAPLRLLALEIYQKSNLRGTPCRLVTGEERRKAFYEDSNDEDNDRLILPNEASKEEFRLFEDVKHTSCTVEMLPVRSRGEQPGLNDFLVDVAVIDEIQMLNDPFRGWAWTQALLGVRAREVHLCGEPTVYELVKSICGSIGETVEYREYERLRPLQVEEKSLKGCLKEKINPGDCLIAFSRKEIFNYKRDIERQCGLQCAVVYGGLPPETRNEQAQLFNNPESGYQVLVASDAVGMGLNLNVRRIIFSTTRKFDGISEKKLSESQVKQIGGRAGRFGMGDMQSGKVTALHENDLDYIRKAMKVPLQQLTQAGVQPTSFIFEQFAKQLPGFNFVQLLTRFEQLARVDQNFFLTDLSDAKKIAQTIRRLPLSIRDRFTLVCAPFRLRDDLEMKAFLEMSRAVSLRSGDDAKEDDGEPTANEGGQSSYLAKNLNAYIQDEVSRIQLRGLCILDLASIRYTLRSSPRSMFLLKNVRKEAVRLPTMEPESLKPYLESAWPSPDTADELIRYEIIHRVVILYLWLHQRFEQTFPSVALATGMKSHLQVLIDRGLQTISHVSRRRRALLNKKKDGEQTHFMKESKL